MTRVRTWAMAAVFTLATIATAQAEATAIGDWAQVDDKTGRVRSTVTISKSGNTFVGRITAIFPTAGEKDEP